MNARKTEDHHHTPEQVSLYVTQACAILHDHELSEIDNAALLPVLVTLLSSKQVFYEQVVPGGMLLPGNARH